MRGVNKLVQMRGEVLIAKKNLTVFYLLLYSGFNRFPYHLLRSYTRHEDNKSKIGQERSCMQQADYQLMSSTQSMNARKCVHAQLPSPSQAFAHESSKVGGRGKERERDRNINYSYYILLFLYYMRQLKLKIFRKTIVNIIHYYMCLVQCLVI